MKIIMEEKVAESVEGPCEAKDWSVKKKELEEHVVELEQEVRNLNNDKLSLENQLDELKEVAWRSFKERNDFEEELCRVRSENELYQFQSLKEKTRKGSLTNEAEDMEQYYHEQRENQEAQLNDVKNQLKKVVAEKEVLNGLLSDCETELETAYKTQHRQEEELADVKEELKSLEGQLKVTKEEMKKVGRENEVLLSQLGVAITEVERMKEEQDTLRKKVIGIKDVLDKTTHEQKISVTEHHMTKRELQLVLGDKHILEDQLIETKGKLRRASEQVESFVYELSNYRTETMAKSNKEQEYKAQLTVTREELKKMSECLNQSKSILSQTKNEFETHIREAKEELRNAVEFGNKITLGTSTTLDGQMMSMQWEIIESQLRCANKELLLEAEIQRTHNRLQKKCVENHKLNTELRKANIQLQSQGGINAAMPSLKSNLFEEAENLIHAIHNEDMEYQMSSNEFVKMGATGSMDRKLCKKTKSQDVYASHYENFLPLSARKSKSTRSSGGSKHGTRGGACAPHTDPVRRRTTRNEKRVREKTEEDVSCVERNNNLSASVEKQKLEELKENVIQKNKNISSLVTKMMEDVDLLKDKLPMNSVFGKKKENLQRKEIIERLHSHLTAAAQCQVDV